MESPSEAACRLGNVRKVYGPVGLTRIKVALCGTKGCDCNSCMGCVCCATGSGGKEVHAVNGVSFAVRTGEVFGLLGANGAGKSSIFNMLAGQISATEGTVHVTGEDMDTYEGVSRARCRIGYCPQENSLLELMSVHEHLLYYATLKGIPSGDVAEVARCKMKDLGLDKHASNLAQNLSGGNKRKLMVAICLIGDPPTILADEPSAGMDPVARRFMWSVIQNVTSRRKRCSVVLSTHSMEECEALCTRSVIMVNGICRTIGTNREIKNMYGGGFELMVKVKKPTESELKAKLDELGLAQDNVMGVTFAAALERAGTPLHHAALHGTMSPFTESGLSVAPKVFAEWWLQTRRFSDVHVFASELCLGKVELLEWTGPMAKYKLWTQKALGELFSTVEEKKEQLGVSEYSLSATTLEEIFTTFARQQLVQEDSQVAMVGQPTGVGGGHQQNLMQFMALATSPVQIAPVDSGEPAVVVAPMARVDKEDATDAKAEAQQAT
eukprot:gnl/TRDRNA2_/TRDRNA2_69854_c0_seq1.p1 gnl/TRDRNA2_/TRDRNA2_69854_c0~~gnl/TRDRNA2_/TRDRNA2_69854_c0_seq1.p1  ORF type:complete len:496 (-),score=115.50 gnl/TRDRNA2_/TRDRNA2_69854_c0_seq1:18-1505(-)